MITKVQHSSTYLLWPCCCCAVEVPWDAIAAVHRTLPSRRTVSEMQPRQQACMPYILWSIVVFSGSSNAYVCENLCSSDKNYTEGVWQRIPSPDISTADELANFTGYKMGSYSHFCFKREVNMRLKWHTILLPQTTRPYYVQCVSNLRCTGRMTS